MTEITKKPFNLEERTLEFSKAIIGLCKMIPKTAINLELIKQAVRAGGSVGANYREANEALGKKDFVYRVRIARKEAKEISYWLALIIDANKEFAKETEALLKESQELRNVFTAIIKKSE